MQVGLVLLSVCSSNGGTWTVNLHSTVLCCTLSHTAAHFSAALLPADAAQPFKLTRIEAVLQAHNVRVVDHLHYL